MVLSSWIIQYDKQSSKERGKCIHAQMWHQNEAEPILQLMRRLHMDN